MNANVLAAAAPAVAVLSQLATLGTVRRGNTLRYRVPRKMVDGETRQLLATALLQAGAGVQFCEQGVVSRPTFATDGAVVWNSRGTRREQEHVTVVVEF